MNSVAITSVSLALSALVFVCVPTLRNSVACFLYNGCSNQTYTTKYLVPNGPDVQLVYMFSKNTTPYINVDIADYDQLFKKGFRRHRPSKFIIHGFYSSLDEEVFQIIKDAYLDTGEYNIFGIDWSKLCKFEYISSVLRIRPVASELAKFVTLLINSGVKPNDIHLIGHSLGAHIAGVSASFVMNSTGEKIGRITGLDPAAPGFESVPLPLKLDSDDATIVDIVHTYAAVLSIAEPLGHVDFYPNGGRIQPGCPDIHDILNVAEGLQCNHARAYKIFAESIRNKNGFKAKKCKTLVDSMKGQCTQKTVVRLGQVESYKESSATAGIQSKDTMEPTASNSCETESVDCKKDSDHTK